MPSAPSRPLSTFHSALSTFMPRRIAATMSLLAFAFCLIVGMHAGNPMTTTLWRALVAMAGTLIVGGVVGMMAQRMLDENVRARRAEQEDAGPSKGQ